jgi:glutaredoxin
MITVYGADWCRDTQRTLRHLRRLHVRHEYVNIDENSAALARARELSGGRRTPTIDLGVGGPALVEPPNDTLTGALVEISMLTGDEALDRMAIQNVGDTERLARTFSGAALLGVSGSVPRRSRWTFRLAGLYLALTGATGWCPTYHSLGVTSLGGPGDRPDEAERADWLARRTPAAVRTA